MCRYAIFFLPNNIFLMNLFSKLRAIFHLANYAPLLSDLKRNLKLKLE